MADQRKQLLDFREHARHFCEDVSFKHTLTTNAAATEESSAYG